MASWEFPQTEPIDAHVSIASGSVRISATPTDVVRVEVHSSRPGALWSRDEYDDLADDVEVALTDGRLRVQQHSRKGLLGSLGTLHVVIGLPEQSRCELNVASADISCEGVLGSLKARTASGPVDVAIVTGSAEVTTISGRIRIDDLASDATMQTASGKIQIRHIGGDLTAQTASGGISIGTAGGSVAARTASGRVRIASIARGHAEVNSVSGDVEVRVTPGTGVYLDLSSITGRVVSDLEPSDQDGSASTDLHLQIRTVSGGLRVARAASAETVG